LTLIEIEKDRLRRQMRQARHALDPQWRDEASAQIAERLLAWTTLSSISVVHCYLAWRSEVATHGLIQQLWNLGKRVVVPKVVVANRQLEHYYIQRFNEIQRGAFDIPEPDPAGCIRAEISEFQLIIAPGVAFDRSGNRLGSGHGYYDRFLAETSALRVGLAFGMQIIDAVPSSSQDQKMNFVATEREIIACDAQ